MAVLMASPAAHGSYKGMPGNHAVFIFIQQVSLNQPVGMVATTLMGHHHLGTYIPVFGVRSIALDGVELWKRLKAVLAEKRDFSLS